MYYNVFSFDEKQTIIDGKPSDIWLKSDLDDEYQIDVWDFTFLTEKGVFHVFGEFFTSEINFLRNDSPDITSCVLSLGRKAGQATCPEHESFQNYYRFFTKILTQRYIFTNILRKHDIRF